MIEGSSGEPWSLIITFCAMAECMVKERKVSRMVILIEVITNDRFELSPKKSKIHDEGERR